MQILQLGFRVQSRKSKLARFPTLTFRLCTRTAEVLYGVETNFFNEIHFKVFRLEFNSRVVSLQRVL